MLRPTFTFKPKRKVTLPLKGLKPKFANEPEQLSGSVNGIPASDLEERFHVAAKQSGKVRQEFFQLTLGGAKGEPGWLSLDYLYETNYGWQAFEIDDVSFIHKGEGEIQEAKLKDIRRVEGLLQMGINLTPDREGRLISHVTNENLSTQEDANRWFKENV